MGLCFVCIGRAAVMEIKSAFRAVGILHETRDVQINLVKWQWDTVNVVYEYLAQASSGIGNLLFSPAQAAITWPLLCLLQMEIRVTLHILSKSFVLATQLCWENTLVEISIDNRIDFYWICSATSDEDHAIFFSFFDHCPDTSLNTGLLFPDHT